MKVYQIGHAYKPNSGFGVIEYLYQLTNQLTKEGVEVIFVQFDSRCREYVEEKDGITILHFPVCSMLGMRLPAGFIKWLNTLKLSGQGYVFHLHSVFYLPNYALARHFQKCRIPYIHTPHDSYSKESLVNNRLLKKLYIAAFDQHVMNGAGTVHAITSPGAASIARYTSNKNIKTVSNFVVPYPAPPAVAVKKQICFIGRMDIYQKGIDLMLAAFKELLKFHPDTVFVLLGVYNPGQMAKFTKLLGKHNLTDGQVKVSGRVSTMEKYKILNESYVYFQLSRFEGFGLSVGEALSMKKPVIISDKIPIAELVKTHRAGYVVSTVAEAVSSLKQIFDLTDTAYSRMAANALTCYEHNFRPELITKQLIEMYQENV